MIDMGSRCVDDLKESDYKMKAIINKIKSW